MQLPKFIWPKSDGARGVLLFAQLVRELLAVSSFESFRVYSLDTVSRLDEAADLATEISTGTRIDRAALEPVITELIWSLRKDPVANLMVASQIEELADLTKISGFSLEKFVRLCVFIGRSLRRTYKSSLELTIVDLIDNRGKRSSLRIAIGFYCSHLLNAGYSREHILAQIDTSFFSRSTEADRSLAIAKVPEEIRLQDPEIFSVVRSFFGLRRYARRPEVLNHGTKRRRATSPGRHSI